MENIKLLKFHVRGIGPLLYGKHIFEPSGDDEGKDQYEERTWKLRCHTDQEGNLTIPSTALHKALISGGKWLMMKIPGGGGKKTYTQRIAAGLMTLQPEFSVLKPSSNGKPGANWRSDEVEKFALFCDPKGGRGSSRVWRFFPRLQPGWNFDAEFVVIDELLTEEVLLKHAKAAGLFDGLGSMRKGNQGPNGQFAVEDLSLTPYEMDF